MMYSIRTLALATALAASAGGVLAQQQQYGRDSVYADPTRATQPSPTAQSAAEPSFGRDSVYAWTSSTRTPVTAGATGLQQYGRGSVYAIQLDQPAGDTGATRIGRAPSEGSNN